MAAARGGTMVVRTGKRSSWRSRGRNQARRGSGSDDTSDEDYRLGADGEEEVSTEDEEDEVVELEVSDGEESCEEEETSSEGSELGDEDEDFEINSVNRRKRKATPMKTKKKATKKKKRKGGRPPAKKRSGLVPRACCEDEVAKPQRRLARKRRRFGGADEDEEAEDGDDVDFSPEDEEEEDDYLEDEELEDEGEDEGEEDLEDEEEDESNDDEEDELFVRISLTRKNGSRKGPAKKQRGGRKKRKPRSGVKKRKRSKTTRIVSKKRRRALVSSDDDDEDDEDFVIEEEEEEDELVDEELIESPGRRQKANNRSGGGNARRGRLALEYGSAGSYSSDSDGIVSGRVVGLVRRPRTGWCGRSTQARQGKGKEAAAEEAAQDPLEKRICGVCLSEERKGHIIGLLDSCAHFFCFTCILEWSKVESRCPVCKQRFATITKSSGSDLAIRLRPIVVSVPKRDQVYQPSEEEVRGYLDPYANVVCIECQQSGEDTLMLLCDLCNSAAHTYCVGLGREVPEGDWYCDACRPADYEQPPDAQTQETENQQVTNGPAASHPCQHGSNRTGRVEIDMNLPYIPSPERPADTFAEEASYFRPSDPIQPAQVVHSHEDSAGRASSRSARQSASTVSERRALHQRIQTMFSNNRFNVNQFRHPESEEREQSVLFNDLNTLMPDFL